MGIKLTRQFEKKNIQDLVNKIYRYIRQDPQLTTRSRRIIRKWFLAQEIFCAFENGKLLGFIAVEYICDNYFELKSWYVVADRRGKDIGEKIFKTAISDRSKTFIGVTFQRDIISRLHEFGFEQLSIHKLPLIVAYRYIMSRKLTSVLKHFFKKRSTLLILRKHE